MNLRRMLEKLVGRAAFMDPATAHKRSSKRQTVKTIVSVIYTTAPKTFSGSAIYVTAGTPEMTSAMEGGAFGSSQDPETDSSAFPSFTTSSEEHKPTADSSLLTSGPIMPSMTSGSASAATSVASSAAAAAHAGMTGGAKAGIAFGVIIGLGLLFALGFFLVRRQKNTTESHHRLDDEKAMVVGAGSMPMYEQQSSGTATPRNNDPNRVIPRLSLRPVTQFSPNLGSDRRSTAARSSVAPQAALGAVAASARSHESGITMTANAAPMSSWERLGSTNAANDPSNPFGNHAETVNPATVSKLSLKDTALPPIPDVDEAAVSPISLAPPRRIGEVNAADFPLPQSGPPSPNPGAAAAASSSKLAQSSAPVIAEEVAAASAAALAVSAAAAKETPPASPYVPAGAGDDKKVHRVQMDFVPSMDDELGIRTGQLIKVQHEYDDGWVLVSYMDNSRSGVVPRTCLSKSPLKPRPQNAPSTPRSGNAPSFAPGAQTPRPLTPGSGRNSPAPFAQAARPQTPTSRNSPAPYAQPPRPSSPYTGRPESPYGSRTASPMGRARAGSNATPYVAYNPNGPRSMSPGPYGAGGLKPTPRPDNLRRRSNSVGTVPADLSKVAAAPAKSQLSQMPVRKPVGSARPSSSDAPAS